jgi:ectoine hydroxylase-related dioxygenase (phytanoyl-CoA dioxygenase family)
VTRSIAQAEIDQYQRDGVLFPIRVLSPEEVSLFRGDLESVARGEGQVSLKRLDNLHLFFGWAYRLTTHPALVSAIRKILGDDLVVYGTLVFYKPPRDASYATWHQDSVYSDLDLTPSTSAWIALTASDAGNGCMRFIPGSHKQGRLDHTNSVDASNLLRRGEQLTAVDESLARDVVLQPGEMSLHNSTIVHGSKPNASDRPRVGFIVRFATSQIANPGWPILRVLGESNCSHLTLAGPPAETDPQKSLAAWQAFSARRRNAAS